jgi:hypothetical protein
MALLGNKISFSHLLYRPIFDRMAVPAKLVLATGIFDTMPDGSPLAALDKTVGVSLPTGGGMILETVTPVAEFMVADLISIGVSKDDLDEGEITLNDKAWTIRAHRMNPSHSGEADGTIFLELEGAAGA